MNDKQEFHANARDERASTKCFSYHNLVTNQRDILIHLWSAEAIWGPMTPIRLNRDAAADLAYWAL